MINFHKPLFNLPPGNRTGGIFYLMADQFMATTEFNLKLKKLLDNFNGLTSEYIKEYENFYKCSFVTPLCKYCGKKIKKGDHIDKTFPDKKQEIWCISCRLKHHK